MAEAQPPTDPHTYNGGCHCGAVRYQVVLDRANLRGALQLHDLPQEGQSDLPGVRVD
ncbi:hypothetical protein LOZ06_006544, partial [Ophidiomyces ophidiicola]